MSIYHYAINKDGQIYADIITSSNKGDSLKEWLYNHDIDYDVVGLNENRNYFTATEKGYFEIVEGELNNK